MIQYWEAWKVNSGSAFTTYKNIAPYDDQFIGGPKGNKVSASARFYEGLALPSSFIPNNRATWAGVLPATNVNPRLPTLDATPPVNRTWIVP